MVAAILVASAELYPVHRVSQRELVVNVFLRECRVLVADVGLVKDVVAADVNAAGLAERKVQFEASHAQAEQILSHLEQTANIHELQVAIAQASGSVVTTHVEIRIHPERDITAKITGGKNAE